MFDYLVVGAGFAGSTIAERLAADAGKKVLICDRRPHIGGNAYDHHDADGILVHKYGPHIFHTNARSVYDYLSRVHRVAAVSASRAGVGRRTAAADSDQSRHGQPAVRPRASRRSSSRSFSSRSPNRSRRSAPPRT